MEGFDVGDTGGETVRAKGNGQLAVPLVAGREAIHDGLVKRGFSKLAGAMARSSVPRRVELLRPSARASMKLCGIRMPEAWIHEQGIVSRLPGERQSPV